MNRRALFALLPVGAALAATAAASGASASGKKEGGGAPTESYIALPTITATIIRPDGRRGVLSVEAGIDVQDETLRARAAQDQPRLRAAYNEAAQRFAAGLIPGRAPDIESLHHALQVATLRTLGKRGAVFLMGSVMVV